MKFELGSEREAERTWVLFLRDEGTLIRLVAKSHKGEEQNLLCFNKANGEIDVQVLHPRFAKDFKGADFYPCE